MGRKRCRRCRRLFAEEDLYSGCFLCGECYRTTLKEYNEAIRAVWEGNGSTA